MCVLFAVEFSDSAGAGGLLARAGLGDSLQIALVSCECAIYS